VGAVGQEEGLVEGDGDGAAGAEVYVITGEGLGGA
jgi:hypothetical protein